MNPNHYVHCGCRGCDCFEQKSQFWGTLKGGGIIILQHLNLNDYVEFDNKISSIMYLRDYLLASEISTVRILGLK